MLQSKLKPFDVLHSFISNFSFRKSKLAYYHTIIIHIKQDLLSNLTTKIVASNISSTKLKNVRFQSKVYNNTKGDFY